MLKIFITILILQFSLHSHTLVFNAMDNEDGTMEVVGMFSTGRSTEGAKLKIVSLATTKILYEKRIPAEGSLTIKIPEEAYKLILDSGPGHVLEKVGDIEPAEGFKKVEISNINYAFYITLLLSSLFIIGAFIVHYFRIKK
jgi:hypothetical protein